MKLVRLLTLALMATIVLQGQKYDVRLCPPDHAGHRYLVSAKGESLQQMSAGGRVLKKENYRVEFEGLAEILTVDGKGEAIRIAFTVEQFIKTEDGEAIELLKPGSVILADGSLKEPISLKDGEIGAAARKAFGLVHAPHKPGDVTDDDVFGTKEPKSIGESWPMNSRLASENLKDASFEIAPEFLQGRLELAAKDKIGDTDCLSLRGELKADSFAMKELPPGFTVDRGAMRAAFRGCFPLNGSALSYRRAVDMSFEIRLTSKDSIIDTKFEQGTDATWKDAGR